MSRKDANESLGVWLLIFSVSIAVGGGLVYYGETHNLYSAIGGTLIGWVVVLWFLILICVQE
jgi:hypothetical protein